jgi:hypothetical protein
LGIVSLIANDPLPNGSSDEEPAKAVELLVSGSQASHPSIPGLVEAIRRFFARD